MGIERVEVTGKYEPNEEIVEALSQYESEYNLFFIIRHHIRLLPKKSGLQTYYMLVRAIHSASLKFIMLFLP